MGRVVASSSTTFSLCISSRASQSFTRPFNPNNRPQPKDGGGIKNKIYTLHTYVRTRLNGLYMKKKKEHDTLLINTDKRAGDGDETN